MISNRLLTAPEAAEYLGMSYKAFRRVMPQIRHKRSGRRGWYKFRTHDLDEWDRLSTIEPQLQQSLVSTPKLAESFDAFDGPVGLDDCPEWD